MSDIEPKPSPIRQWHKVTYLIASGAYVKIGITTDIDERMRTLLIGSPHPLLLLGYLKGNREREMHQKFSALRVRGEWFLREPIERWFRYEAMDKALLGVVDPQEWTFQ